MLASVKDILKKAKDNRYAVGAFNVFNMEETQAVVRAAVKKKFPVIIQISEKTIEYGGDGMVAEVVKLVIDKESGDIPIGFHLDHGHSFDSIVQAIEFGVQSVMIDASRHELNENIAITKRVVDFAHSKNVPVQAEIGKVVYLAEMESDPDWDKLMTDPEEAKKMVEATGVDALAVCIGNAHGFAREKEVPDWERLSKINEAVPDTPLILHGASDWVNHKVAEAVKRGIVCFNVDTDLRLAFNKALCQFTDDKCSIIDPRAVMAEAREAVQRVVEKKIEMFRNP